MAENNHNIFGTRLDALRKERGINKADLAEALGLNRKTIYALINDPEKNPSLNVLCELADFFSVSIDYLTGRTDNREQVVVRTKQQFFNRKWDEENNASSHRDRQGENSNAPLSLDDLLSMDGQPVWCQFSVKGQSPCYGIVHGKNITGFRPGDTAPVNLLAGRAGAYGLAWVAYRRKPEEG